MGADWNERSNQRSWHHSAKQSLLQAAYCKYCWGSQTNNLARTPSYLLHAREQSIKCFGVHLFNKLPKSIRNITNVSVDAFKNQLDKYIKTIEDPASLSQTQQHWLDASTPAAVYMDTPPSPHLLQRDVEQTTPSLPIYPIAEASIRPLSGPQAQLPTTQTLSLIHIWRCRRGS